VGAVGFACLVFVGLFVWCFWYVWFDIFVIVLDCLSVFWYYWFRWFVLLSGFVSFVVGLVFSCRCFVLRLFVCNRGLVVGCTCVFFGVDVVGLLFRLFVFVWFV